MNTKRKEWLEYQYDYLNFTTTKRTQYNKIMTTFSNQGHSGFSTNYLINILRKYPKCSKEKITKHLESINKDNDNIQSTMNRNIIEILNLLDKFEFNEEECNNIYRLMGWTPIIPLTGEDAEWDKGITNEDMEQNKLCSAVFRDNHDNSTAHYIYGRIFSDDGGYSWFSSSNSSINITFPFIVPDYPEKVYLDKDGNDITNNQELINKLYKEAENKYKK